MLFLAGETYNRDAACVLFALLWLKEKGEGASYREDQTQSPFCHLEKRTIG